MTPGKCLGTIAGSGAVGTVGIALLSHWYFILTAPRLVRDGQYGMIFIIIGPIGWVVGSLIGGLIMRRYLDENPDSTASAFFILIVGLLVSPFIALAPFFIVSIFNALRSPGQ